jgi:hypothetical protein
MPPRAPKKTEAARRREIERYLQTGDDDEHYSCWPGSSFLERVEEGDRMLRAALIAEVQRRARDCLPPSLPRRFDPRRFARRQVTPMVEGLFPAKERPVILDLLGSSLVFLTRENIGEVLAVTRYLHSAWDLANLYLGSLGCPGLDGRPARLVGMSEETTCYVSTAYFEVEDPFADYVVHEAAHIFHNWKRERVGLPHTRYREWLLQIDFGKRETFAYACEAYSRIRERSRGLADRKRLHAAYAESWVPHADHLDSKELVDILGEAVAARNGWKRILARCSPPKRARGGRSPRGL